jgi:hypothetical protein
LVLGGTVHMSSETRPDREIQQHPASLLQPRPRSACGSQQPVARGAANSSCLSGPCDATWRSPFPNSEAGHAASQSSCVRRRKLGHAGPPCNAVAPSGRHGRLHRLSIMPSCGCQVREKCPDALHLLLVCVDRVSPQPAARSPQRPPGGEGSGEGPRRRTPWAE